VLPEIPAVLSKVFYIRTNFNDAGTAATAHITARELKHIDNLYIIILYETLNVKNSGLYSVTFAGL
jgi:hypothetical protein